MRAILYLAMGRSINAIRDYSTVLTLKPDHAKVGRMEPISSCEFE